MTNIEQSIETLENKVKKMTFIIIGLCVLCALSILSNFFKVEMNQAQAQSGSGYVIAPPNVPVAVEAQSFILKDSQGNIRGMWSAEENSTTFATAYKQKEPFISLNVDRNEATMTLSDNRNNQIILSNSNSKGQSLAMGNVLNPSHNILLGYTPEETSFELISTNSARIGMSGRNILIEALGKTSDIVLAEREGSYVNINSSNTGNKISFVDGTDYENIKVEYKDGRSEITIISPSTQGKTVIEATPNK